MAGDELSDENFTLPYKATNFSSLGQHNFSGSDHDAVSASDANSGGNSLFGGLVAINAGNPAISIALALNDVSISQNISSEAVGASNAQDNKTGVPTGVEPVEGNKPVATKPFGSLVMDTLNISDHDANAFSLANSGGNSVIGGLLAINAGNPTMSYALGINSAPVTQQNTGHDLNGEFKNDFYELG